MDWRLRKVLRDRVVITLKDGQSFRGIYDGSDKNHHELVDAEYLKPDGALKVDGRVFVPREHVAFIQKP